MSKPHIHAAWKVIDIHSETVSLSTDAFLSEQEPVFDARMGDYGIHDIDSLLNNPVTQEETPEDVREELEAIQKVISKKGCSYFRIVG